MAARENAAILDPANDEVGRRFRRWLEGIPIGHVVEITFAVVAVKDRPSRDVGSVVFGGTDPGTDKLGVARKALHHRFRSKYGMDIGSAPKTRQKAL
jgi:hypothetical protein